MQETTYIIKRVQRADNGHHTYIVRETAGSDGNLGVTYIYEEPQLNEIMSEKTFDELDILMPDLDGQSDNLKAFKVTTVIEEVDATELFVPCEII